MTTDPFGTASKFVRGALALSYGPSSDHAQSSCDRRCPHFGTDCYAAAIEKFRNNALAKLIRHARLGPYRVTLHAIASLRARIARGAQIPWLRISVSGALPARPSRAFLRALTEFLRVARAANIPIHLPIEGHKADTYRALLPPTLVTIRRSAYSRDDFLRADGPSAYGDPAHHALPRRERIAAARAIAHARRAATGRLCVLCPATVYGALRRPAPDTAKCGGCTICAMERYDVVYVTHSRA